MSITKASSIRVLKRQPKEMEITCLTDRPWNTKARLSTEKATTSTLMASSTEASGRKIRCRAMERCTGLLLKFISAIGKVTSATDRVSKLG